MRMNMGEKSVIDRIAEISFHFAPNSLHSRERTTIGRPVRSCWRSALKSSDHGKVFKFQRDRLAVQQTRQRQR